MSYVELLLYQVEFLHLSCTRVVRGWAGQESDDVMVDPVCSEALAATLQCLCLPTRFQCMEGDSVDMRGGC